MKILVFTLLLSSAQFAWAKKFKLDNVKVRSGVFVDIVEADDIKARIFGYNLSVDIKDQLASDLNLFLGASAILETGSNEVVGTVAEFEPNEGINLDRGGLEYSPISLLKVKLGALNQSKFESPLFLGSTAFAAAEEQINLSWFYLRVQQAIPSNNKLSKRLGTLDTGTPYLATETLGIKFGKKNKLRFETTHFNFKDLSSNIAQNSNTLGNSTNGVGESTSFNYNFEGINVFFKSEFGYSTHRFIVNAQYIYNNDAPSGRNTGTLMDIGYKWRQFGFFIESFENESDTSPAFYNSKYYGHNNMKGNTGSFKVIGKDINLNLRYTSMKPIENNNLQTNTEIFTFNISKDYEF